MLEAAQLLDSDPGMKGTIVYRTITELEREPTPGPSPTLSHAGNERAIGARGIGNEASEVIEEIVPNQARHLSTGLVVADSSRARFE